MALTSGQIEQTKLRATYLNGIAITVFAVGGFAPWVSLVGSPNADLKHVAVNIVLTLICGGASLWRHYVAVRSLRDLDKDTP